MLAFMTGFFAGFATMTFLVVWEIRANIRKWENPDA